MLDPVRHHVPTTFYLEPDLLTLPNSVMKGSRRATVL